MPPPLVMRRAIGGDEGHSTADEVPNARADALDPAVDSDVIRFPAEILESLRVDREGEACAGAVELHYDGVVGGLTASELPDGGAMVREATPPANGIAAPSRIPEFTKGKKMAVNETSGSFGVSDVPVHNAPDGQDVVLGAGVLGRAVVAQLLGAGPAVPGEQVPEAGRVCCRSGAHGDDAAIIGLLVGCSSSRSMFSI